MNRKTAVLLLAVSLVLSAAARADVKGELIHKYKSQVLALRSPFVPGSQIFDSAGQPAGARPAGPWLLFGGIVVEKIGLSSHELRLEGHRIGFTGEEKKGKTVVVSLGKTVRVEIHLDQPLQSLDQAQAVMDRVFFLQADPLDHARPELRRADDSTRGGPIYHLKKDEVQAPTPTYVPEPDYSEEARRARFRGAVKLNIVVDQSGSVSRVRLDKALGHGLDENAMQGVKLWRFRPATRNGEPVPVEMQVEVSFNLY